MLQYVVLHEREGVQNTDIADAKMLYAGICRPHMSLFAKNGWIDKNGRVCISFLAITVREEIPNCAEQKAIMFPQ